MFDRFDAIVFKVSEYCNLDCIYCFQKYDTKTRTRQFDYFDELVKFLRKLPIGSQFEVKITGGESSLHCDRIRYAYKKIKKLERTKDTEIRFTTISNGSNIQGLIDLWDDKILDPWGCKISWDGIFSATKSRKPKIGADIYTDKFFNKTIVDLGKSPYGSKVLVRTACTLDTIDNLFDAYKFAKDNGCFKWEYYPLSDADFYKDKNFLDKFKDQLYMIFEDHRDEKNPNKLVANIDTLAFANVLDTKDRYRSVSCRHLGHFLHIGIDGSLYPCGYFSDDAFYENQAVNIGDIFNGFDRKVMESFTEEYSQTPMCSIAEEDGCKCYHCFECPAVSKFYKNNMQHKMRQQCAIRQIEREVFLDVFKGYQFNTDEIKNHFNYETNFKQENSRLNEDLPFFGG